MLHAPTLSPLRIVWYVRSAPCCGEEVNHVYYDGTLKIECVCGEWISTPRYSKRNLDLMLVSEN
jgi:hypothetical protein